MVIFTDPSFYLETARQAATNLTPLFLVVLAALAASLVGPESGTPGR